MPPSCSNLHLKSVFKRISKKERTLCRSGRVLHFSAKPRKLAPARHPCHPRTRTPAVAGTGRPHPPCVRHAYRRAPRVGTGRPVTWIAHALASPRLSLYIRLRPLSLTLSLSLSRTAAAQQRPQLCLSRHRELHRSPPPPPLALLQRRSHLEVSTAEAEVTSPESSALVASFPLPLSFSAFARVSFASSPRTSPAPPRTLPWPEMAGRRRPTLLCYHSQRGARSCAPPGHPKGTNRCTSPWGAR